MNLFKYILLVIVLISLFPNLLLSQDEESQENHEIVIDYFLLYDWIRDEPLLSIPKEDITLFPFYIQRKKGRDFTSYRHVSNWESIGADSAGLNISRIVGFDAMYIVNNNRALDIKDFGKFISPDNLNFNLIKKEYIASSSSSGLEVSSKIEDKVRTIKYLDKSKREILIVIDESNDGEIKYEKYLNNALTMEADISKDLSNITIKNKFAGQSISMYKKSKDTANLYLPGLSFKSSKEDNLTILKSSGRNLTIMTNSDHQIVSIELTISGKTRYAKDYDFFNDYILISEFDVLEGIITETEIDYNDIILYELKKNIEDVVFSKYELDKDSAKATLSKYQGGREIVSYKYSFDSGIIKLSDIIYENLDESAKTEKAFHENKISNGIYRDKSIIFSSETTGNKINNRVKSTSSNIKVSSTSYNNGEYQSYINFSDIKVNSSENINNYNITEKISVAPSINISRIHSHRDNNYESITLKNRDYKTLLTYEYRSGIGLKTISNYLQSNPLIKRYDTNGNLISKSYNTRNIKWNSYYGYKKGEKTVTRDIIDGVLMFISLFRRTGESLNIVTYDTYSRKILENNIKNNIEMTLEIVGNVAVLIYEKNKKVIEKSINDIRIPVIGMIKNLDKIIKYHSLDIISEKSYNIGLTKYKEVIDNDNNYIKYIIDENENLYQEIILNNGKTDKEIIIYSNNEYFNEAKVILNEIGLPEDIKITKSNNQTIDVNNIGFDYQYNRNITNQVLTKDLQLLCINDDNQQNMNMILYKTVKIKNLNIYPIEEINIKQINNLENFMLSLMKGDQVIFVKYESNLPTKIYIANSNNEIIKILFIKNFLHYAYQSIISEGNIYNSIIEDTNGNVLFNQMISYSNNNKNIVTDAGDFGNYNSTTLFNDNGTVKNITIIDSENNKYFIENLYGDSLSTNLSTYSINDNRIGINVTRYNDSGNILEENQYKYSMENGLWELYGDKEIILTNRYNNIVDKKFNIPLQLMSKYQVLYDEFWYVYDIDF